MTNPLANLSKLSYAELNRMVVDRLAYINTESARIEAVRKEVKTIYIEVDKIIRGERTQEALPVETLAERVEAETQSTSQSQPDDNAESPEAWLTPAEVIEQVAEAANVDLVEVVGKKIEEVRELIGDPWPINPTPGEPKTLLQVFDEAGLLEPTTVDMALEDFKAGRTECRTFAEFVDGLGIDLTETDRKRVAEITRKLSEVAPMMKLVYRTDPLTPEDFGGSDFD